MNPLNLLKSMGEMGVMFSERHIASIMDYCSRMLEDERIIRIDSEGKPVAFIFYSLGDPEKFLKKGEYEYRAHDPKSETVYVEKLVSFTWNRSLRILFEKLITHKYPQLKSGAWHRRGKRGDRPVITKRRLQHV